MIDVGVLLLLLWLHFVADFIMQTDEMAQKKSSSNMWLAWHVAVYTLPFLIFGPLFAAVNYVAHFVTDYISSRATSWLYKRDERHWFFVVIGLDQALHVTALILSYIYLV